MTCGLTPQKLALTLCFGTAIGVLPLLWGTTFICILLAHFFRLNQVALLSVNYLLYPIQLLLLIPFYKLGMWLFPWGPQVSSNMLSILAVSPNPTSLNILVWITFKSLAAWGVTVLPSALLTYGILRITVFRENTLLSEH